MKLNRSVILWGFSVLTTVLILWMAHLIADVQTYHLLWLPMVGFAFVIMLFSRFLYYLIALGWLSNAGIIMLYGWFNFAGFIALLSISMGWL